MADSKIIVRNEPKRTTNTVAPSSPQPPNILDKNPTSGLNSLHETIKLLSEKQITKVVENATVLEYVTGPNKSLKTKYTIAHLNTISSADPNKQHRFEDCLLKIRCPEYDEGVRQNPEDILIEAFGSGISPSEAFDSTKNDKDKKEALFKYYKCVADHLTFAPLVSNGVFSPPPKPGDKVRIHYFQDPRVSSGEPIAGFYEKMYNENIFESLSSSSRELLSKYRQKYINNENQANSIIPGSTSNVPQTIGIKEQKTTTQTVSSNSVTDSYENSVSGKTAPGLYEIVTNGKSEGFVEMVYLRGTKILYPKKYFRALESMREAYKQETGQVLGINSGYRDVKQQEILYNAFLARNKAPPKVARPGFSLHNNGRAVDIDTGQPHNSNYERDSFKTKEEIMRNGVPSGWTKKQNSEDYIPTQQTAESMARTGNYGTAAKWLVENGRRFGYTWVGYSIRELWHYELDVNLAKSLGLID